MKAIIYEINDRKVLLMGETLFVELKPLDDAEVNEKEETPKLKYKGKRRKTSSKDIGNIIALFKKENSVGEIVRKTGIGYITVAKYIKLYKKDPDSFEAELAVSDNQKQWGQTGEVVDESPHIYFLYKCKGGTIKFPEIGRA